MHKSHFNTGESETLAGTLTRNNFSNKVFHTRTLYHSSAASAGNRNRIEIDRTYLHTDHNITIEQSSLLGRIISKLTTVKWVIVLALILNTGQGNSQAILKNDIYLGLASGIGGQFYPEEFGDALPLIGGKLLVGLQDNVALDLTGGYSSAKTTEYSLLGSRYTINYSYIFASGRLKYYFYLTDHNSLDLNIGLGGFYALGVGSIKKDESLESYDPEYPKEVIIDYTASIGARYWVSSSTAVWMEVTRGMYYVQAGIQFHIY